MTTFIRHAAHAVLLATVFAACRENSPVQPPEPLAIVDRFPASGALGVEVGAAIVIELNQRLDPATVSAATIQVMGQSALVIGVTYDSAARTIRITAPLSANEGYNVTVTTGLQTADGRSFGSNQSWSFRTRLWGPARRVDSLGVGLFSTLVIDSTGRRHVAYADNVKRDLKYATCASGCEVAANWQLAVIDTAEISEASSLVLSGGRVHVSYSDAYAGDLRYATCAGTCGDAANWETALIDSVAVAGFYSSFVADESGGLHVAYQAWTGPSDADVKYATCTASCTNTASWQSILVQHTTGAPGRMSLATDAAGRLHLAFRDGSPGDLRYAHCSASCGSAASWQAVTVDDENDLAFFPSVAVDGRGRVHILYEDITEMDLQYATCAMACTTAAGWQRATIDTLGGETPSLQIDALGRLHAAYYARVASQLDYITCAALCREPGSWVHSGLDFAIAVGETVSLFVEANGRVHATYWDNNAGMPEFTSLRYVY